MRPLANAHALSAPVIQGVVPGPLGAALIARDERYTSPSYTRPYPLAVKRGRGCWIEDLDGNRFLDFTGGIAVCATGHCHERVVSAIQRQAAELLHMCGADFYYEPLAALAERLARLAPGSGEKRVLFTNSGAEAIEAAIKLARWKTRRPCLVAFQGGFHGRTLGALSLTASKAVQRRGFSPLLPGVFHLPFPDAHDAGRSDPTGETLHALESLFRTIASPDEIAAIVVEPIQGEGGYIIPPADFLPQLEQVARRHGILLIADEIQTGVGRTGRMFAVEHCGVEPDVLCLAKGLASGLPLGAIVARAEISDWPPGAHASTFGGNPLSCVAALETLALVEESLMSNAQEQGQYLLSRLTDVAARAGGMISARGLGLMLAVDFVQDGEAGARESDAVAPDASRRDAVIMRAFDRGLLLLGCGQSSLRLCPPLIVTRAECATAMEILASAVADVRAAEESPHGDEAEPSPHGDEAEPSPHGDEAEPSPHGDETEPSPRLG